MLGLTITEYKTLELRVNETLYLHRKKMQFAVANPFTRLLPSGNIFMWKRLWSQDFQDEPLKILSGKQITMKLSSASSEFCDLTRSMSKVMSVSKFIEKSFTQYEILSFASLQTIWLVKSLLSEETL